MLFQVSFLLREKLDFIEENSDFPIDKIPQKVYNKYRNQGEGVIKMNFEKSDWEWLISIITGIATPFILEWLKAKGLFKRQDHRK